MTQRKSKQEKVNYEIGCPKCGSSDVVVIGGGYQEADASRNMPMIEAVQMACNACGRIWWD